MIANSDSLRGIDSCTASEDRPLNTSDHLLIMCYVDISHIRYPTQLAFPTFLLDWTEGRKCLQTAVTNDIIIRSLLGKCFNTFQQLGQQSNCFRSRKSIRGHIPMYNLWMAKAACSCMLSMVVRGGWRRDQHDLCIVLPEAHNE